MNNLTKAKPTETNFSFNLFRSVDRDFEGAVEAGCYQKKALLTRLLSLEIERLDQALDTKVPERVTQKIRNLQNTKALEKYWVKRQVALPVELVDRIHHVCKSKGVLRDAWVNRVLFFAAGTKLFDALVHLEGLRHWDYFERDDDNRELAIALVTQRLKEPLDPLFHMHELFREFHDGINSNNGNIYRFKLFEDHRKPRAQLATAEPLEFKRRILIHQFSWCITCWADESDLDKQIEPNFEELEL
jgi:hypothetical protein